MPATAGLRKPLGALQDSVNVPLAIPHDLVSIREAALIAKLHPKTVGNWVKARQLNVWGRPGCYRVSLAEVLPCIPSNPTKRINNRVALYRANLGAPAK